MGSRHPVGLTAGSNDRQEWLGGVRTDGREVKFLDPVETNPCESSRQGLFLVIKSESWGIEDD